MAEYRHGLYFDDAVQVGARCFWVGGLLDRKWRSLRRWCYARLDAWVRVRLKIGTAAVQVVGIRIARWCRRICGQLVRKLEFWGEQVGCGCLFYLVPSWIPWLDYGYGNGRWIDADLGWKHNPGAESVRIGLRIAGKAGFTTILGDVVAVISS